MLKFTIGIILVVMEHNMILSASGWRKVFAESGEGEDYSPAIGQTNRELSALIAETFAEYIKRIYAKKPVIAVGMDSRPTGKEIADAVLRGLISQGIGIHYIGIASAPEIMAYGKTLDGFLYISASHNPIGHNGIKFGLNDGGVLNGEENAKLVKVFLEKCSAPDAQLHAEKILSDVDVGELRLAYALASQYKKDSLWTYEDFIRVVISGTTDTHEQDELFSIIKSSIMEQPLGIVADMNGSARCQTIDETFLSGCGITFLPFNNEAGTIPHAIIPEPENLTWCADVMEDLQKDGETEATLGFMPDCDGDRGNIVYWDEKEKKARAIPAQEVFALCVLAESAFDIWKQKNMPHKSLLWKAVSHYGRNAVVVNGPTSMRVDEICRAFKRDLFRAEVGEANVVNLAREKRDSGYTVRILGEGSNGGNITYPSAVRDPVATIFALIKLLVIRDSLNLDGSLNKGLFHLWCEKSDQEFKYRDDFTLSDVIATLPEYTTTGVSDELAVLNVQTEDKGILKENFRKVFVTDWEHHREEMEAIYGIESYRVFLTNGTVEREVSIDESWNNGNGGLKIQFYDGRGLPYAFIWMRPSGTEPVFRIMCDVRGNEFAAERSLLRWETTMIKKADSN